MIGKMFACLHINKIYSIALNKNRAAVYKTNRIMTGRFGVKNRNIQLAIIHYTIFFNKNKEFMP